jgi:hypothetical protein
MLTRFIGVVILTAAMGACAHHGAPRAGCDGPLRPINHPDPIGTPSEAPRAAAPPNVSPAHPELVAPSEATP